LYATKNQLSTPNIEILNDYGEWKNLTAITPYVSQNQDYYFVTKNKSMRARIYGPGQGWLQYEIQKPSASGNGNHRSKRSSKSISNEECPVDVYFEITQIQQVSAMSTANTRTFNVLLTTEFSESSVFKSSNVHDEIFVVHIALKSSKQIFEEDFELLNNPVEHIVEHYTINDKSVIFYIRGNGTLKFRMNFETNLDNSFTITTYPVKHPGLACKSVHNPYPDRMENLRSHCEQSDCICGVLQDCPKKKKPKKATKEKRMDKHEKKDTMYSYRLKYKDPITANVPQGWKAFSCELIEVYYSSGELQSVTSRQRHQFWVRDDCKKFSLKRNRYYLIIGSSAVIGQNRDGSPLVKHLLDSNSWIEEWPSKYPACNRYGTGNSKKITLTKTCKSLQDFVNNI